MSQDSKLNQSDPNQPQTNTRGFTVSNIQLPVEPAPRPEVPTASNGFTADNIQVPDVSIGDNEGREDET